MQSKKPVEPLDTIESDVPMTAADHEAQWRVRELNSMSPAEYLLFLLTFTKDLPPSRRINTDSDKPFEL
jgi:hypothetical protein